MCLLCDGHMVLNLRVFTSLAPGRGRGWGSAMQIVNSHFVDMESETQEGRTNKLTSQSVGSNSGLLTSRRFHKTMLFVTCGMDSNIHYTRAGEQI